MNIWKLADYDGKLKITTKFGIEHIGTVCLIEDVDEDDDYESECVFLDCEDGTWAVFAHEIAKIEPLG